MAGHHSPRFLKVVDAAKARIRETTVEEVKAQLDAGAEVHFIDVREESEFAAGRCAGAHHIGKGVLERDIEGAVPDPDAAIVLY
jgi:rhodanese-related sulfurtransferase